MFITLTRDELELLTRITDSYLAELAVELQHTDNLDYRDKLREEKTHLSLLVSRLKDIASHAVQPLAAQH